MTKSIIFIEDDKKTSRKNKWIKTNNRRTKTKTWCGIKKT
jgi:hypothetical protein